MRNFFYNLSYKYSQFMAGRYGVDELNIFLLIASFAMILLSRVFGGFVFNIASWVFLILCVYRMYSKNISKRYEEKEKFLVLKSRFMSWCSVKRDAWNHRKTHKYFRCQNCRASIRVPRGVGKVRVSCPKCRKEMIKKA